MNENDRKKSSLTNQSAWILFAKVTGFALNTLLPLLVVRYLTQENVGIYRQSFLVASNAVLVLPLGFSMSAYYFLNRDPEKHSSTVFNILIFNFVMGGLAFLTLFLFPQLLGSTFQNQELARLSPVVGLVIWFWIFSSFIETVTLALQEARLAALFIVLGQLVKTALMVAAVLYFSTVDSLLYAGIAVFAVQSVVLLVYLEHRFPGFWRHFDGVFFGKQMAYALPFGLSVLLYVGQTDIHNYFVSHSFSAREFAIYSQGCFDLPLIAMLYESVGAVMIPRMSRLQHEGKEREMLLMSANATQKLAFFYFPIFCFLQIVAFEFITTLFTNNYAASVPIFRVNLLALPLFSLVVDPVIRAFPVAARSLLKLRIAIVVVLVTVFWLGIGRLGLIAMISIVVGAILFEKLAAGWISGRMLGVKAGDALLLKQTGKIAVAAAASGIVLLSFYLLGHEALTQACMRMAEWVLSLAAAGKGAEFVGGSLYLGVCLLIYAPVYLIFADLLGVIEPAEKEKVLSILRRFTRRGRPVGSIEGVKGDA